MGELIVMDNFRIDEAGYALILKLIEQRIIDDLAANKQELENEQYNRAQLEQKDGFFNGIKQKRTDGKLQQLSQTMERKAAWLDKWQNDNWKQIPNAVDYRDTTIETLVAKYRQSVDGRIKLYLILQEAVFSPVYGEFEGYPKGLKEVDYQKGIERITRLCGLEGALGLKMLKNTESFFKDIKNENGRIAKWATTGFLAVAALAAVAAVPFLAPAVGAAMGLSGAAATAAGLAFFGGGSLAAGGLGMAGGMSILIGGSALLGAVGGGSLAKMLGKVPQEAIALNLSKSINFMEYLTTVQGSDRPRANQVYLNTRDLFLDFKHSSERELMNGQVEGQKKDHLQLSQILYQAYKKILMLGESGRK